MVPGCVDVVTIRVSHWNTLKLLSQYDINTPNFVSVLLLLASALVQGY